MLGSRLTCGAAPCWSRLALVHFENQCLILLLLLLILPHVVLCLIGIHGCVSHQPKVVVYQHQLGTLPCTGPSLESSLSAQLSSKDPRMVMRVGTMYEGPNAAAWRTNILNAWLSITLKDSPLLNIQSASAASALALFLSSTTSVIMVCLILPALLFDKAAASRDRTRCCFSSWPRCFLSAAS